MPSSDDVPLGGVVRFGSCASVRGVPAVRKWRQRPGDAVVVGGRWRRLGVRPDQDRPRIHDREAQTSALQMHGRINPEQRNSAKIQFWIEIAARLHGALNSNGLCILEKSAGRFNPQALRHGTVQTSQSITDEPGKKRMLPAAPRAFWKSRGDSGKSETSAGAHHSQSARLRPCAGATMERVQRGCRSPAADPGACTRGSGILK